MVAKSPGQVVTVTVAFSSNAKTGASLRVQVAIGNSKGQAVVQMSGASQYKAAAEVLAPTSAGSYPINVALYDDALAYPLLASGTAQEQIVISVDAPSASGLALQSGFPQYGFPGMPWWIAGGVTFPPRLIYLVSGYLADVNRAVLDTQTPGGFIGGVGGNGRAHGPGADYSDFGGFRTVSCMNNGETHLFPVTPGVYTPHLVVRIDTDQSYGSHVPPDPAVAAALAGTSWDFVLPKVTLTAPANPFAVGAHILVGPGYQPCTVIAAPPPPNIFQPGYVYYTRDDNGAWNGLLAGDPMLVPAPIVTIG